MLLIISHVTGNVLIILVFDNQRVW